MIERGIKTTQGSKKLCQYLNDLKKNKKFIKLEEKIKKEKNPKKKREFVLEMAEKYGIDMELYWDISNRNKEITHGYSPDVCEIIDNYDVISYEEEHPFPISKDVIRLMNIMAYPISINIYPHSPIQCF